MRPLAEMTTIQLEVTNWCVLKCANCTRFAGSVKTPYFMEFDFFQKAVDSLVDFPGMVGIMGGEPLLHPRFTELCEYAASKIPRERLGLWSVFPEAPKFRDYREIICKTFGNVLLNDHSRPDIMHGPVLVGIEEIIKDRKDLFLAVESCWVQNHWSASVNPKGGFFCEVAAAMSMLFDGPDGWPIEPGWWKRTPKDFTSQIERWCPQCGCAVPLKRRSSQDTRDDISPKNLERLRGLSRKVDRGEYVASTFQMDPVLMRGEMYPVQVYKDREYRRAIAGKYGIELALNAAGFEEPFLKPDWTPQANVFEMLKQ